MAITKKKCPKCGRFLRQWFNQETWVGYHCSNCGFHKTKEEME